MAGSLSSGPSTKPYNVSELKARLMRPALTSHYICEFSPIGLSVETWLNQRASSNKFSGENYTANQELFQISCCDASLPGSSLTTNDINDDYHGVSEKHAYRRLYDDRADFTFYVDNDYKIISFFEGWISYIVGEEGSGGQLENPNYFYRVNFPNTYKTKNLYIRKFEKDSGNSGGFGVSRNLEYKFFNAYPISINSMPVSYEQSQLLKCTVSFSYERYIVTKDGGYKTIPTPTQQKLSGKQGTSASAAAAAYLVPTNDKNFPVKGIPGIPEFPINKLGGEVGTTNSTFGA